MFKLGTQGKIMIVVEYSSLQSGKKIQKILSLNKNSLQKIKDWMSQIQFCTTILN